MALREILTHQGASAGVYFPDLSSPFTDLDDRTSSDSLKKPQGIDLNEDIDVEQLEPVLKRHKKDEANPSEIMLDQLSEGHKKEEPDPTEIMDIDLDKELVNGDDQKVEASVSNVLTVTSGGSSFAHVKVEAEFQLDGSTDPSKVDTSCSSLPKTLSPASNPSSVIHVPENSKYMKLMKLAKYSCMKNWEFLQDCAIRFLCVLSLDRYAFLDFKIETCVYSVLCSLSYSLCHILLVALVIMYLIKWLPLFVKLALKLLVLFSSTCILLWCAIR